MNLIANSEARSPLSKAWFILAKLSPFNLPNAFIKPFVNITVALEVSRPLTTPASVIFVTVKNARLILEITLNIPFVVIVCEFKNLLQAAENLPSIKLSTESTALFSASLSALNLALFIRVSTEIDMTVATSESLLMLSPTN